MGSFRKTAFALVTLPAIGLALVGCKTNPPNALSNGLAPTTIYAKADFEGGSIPSPFYADTAPGNSVTVTSALAHSGIYSVLCQANETDYGAGVSFNMPQSVMIDGDFYVRWYILVPAATLSNTASAGQIKLYLSRTDTNTATNQGWFMLGEGAEFNSTNNSFASRIDYGVVIVDTGPVIAPDVWHEVEVYQHRDSATQLGTSRVWYDGQLQGEATSANMGGSDATAIYWTRMGIAYTQHAASYPLQVYVDDIVAANGFIGPAP